MTDPHCRICGTVLGNGWLQKHPQAALCMRCFYTAMTRLLFDAAPETPEEVDAELRAAGLDPEKIGRECAELAKRLLEKHKP